MKYLSVLLLLFVLALSVKVQAMVSENNTVKNNYKVPIIETCMNMSSANGMKDNIMRVPDNSISKNLSEENISEVRIHGKVVNSKNEPMRGASIVVKGSNLGVNTNENGEFFMNKLPSGTVSLIVSFVGYETQVVVVNLVEVNNELNVTLNRNNVVLEPVTITSQHREQQILDIPATITNISSSFILNANITNLEQVSDFVPGMNVRIQTPHRPTFVIRGLSSDEVSPGAQPRVSVYFNQVSVSRASMAVSELYDMERVEIIKGPQGTLFGRGSQIGAISFITKKPTQELNGYFAAGMGDYGQRELQGAVNLPVIDNKLFMRASGIYSYSDGYVENTFGGTLNGKNTIGGRFSLRYMPFHNTKIDLVLNYQKDDNPGTAFMSRQFPNTKGVTDIFNYEASLEQGKNLYNKRDVLGTSLEIKHFRNENNYWSSITSVYTNNGDSRFDGDGTHAPAIDMAEALDVKQFTQELRYNFSLNSRTNGFIGASYWRENVKHKYWFGPNEQHLAYLFLQMPQFLIAPDGNAYPMTAIPNNPAFGPLAGMPLPVSHEEENHSGAKNQAIDLFVDATWKLTHRLSFTSGLRVTAERFTVNNKSMMTGGSPSVLGMFTGNYPNVFFKPVDFTRVQENYMAYTWRANFKYDINPHSNFFIGYAKGRRPNVIQYNAKGESETMNQENVHSFDAGVKIAAMQRFWFDVGVFYQLYSNFQTTAWDAASINYIIKDAGKATSYGVEAIAKAAIFSNLDVFANYAYIHARFDNSDSQGNEQEYAGNSFRLTPDHSFAIGFHAKAELTTNWQIFVVPTYAWKSHVWFEDANTSGLDQDSYGLLSAQLGFKLHKPNLIVAVTGTNLLNEKYTISGGNAGSLFGVPTFIPGAPRMIGTKLTWKF